MVEDESIDSFHRGGFSLVQPRLSGHRSGMDAMLLAGLVPGDFDGVVVDLGAGAGAAGFAVGARCLDAKITLVERSNFMADYAQKSLALPANQAISPRIKLIKADIALKGNARQQAGLLDNAFDFAIMNPPFNLASDRKTPDEHKAEAHVMPDKMFEDWLRTAAAIVKPGGYLGIIARPQSIEDILMALEGRFGAIQIIPLYPRENMHAIRILIHAKRASKAALSLLPGLIIHNGQSQEFSARVDAINNGRISMWDAF